MGVEVSSIEAAVVALQKQLESLDVDVLSGTLAARVVDVLTPMKHCLDAVVVAAAARAVSVNQHNVDGARSGAAWIAAKSGVSEKQARSDLATQKLLSELADVGSAVRSGELSLQKASLIGRAADGDASRASELLAVARRGLPQVWLTRLLDVDVMPP